MIGIFGSTFNPPTLGHIDAIKKCLKECDTLFIMPSYNHPIKNNVIGFNIRLLMTKSILDDFQLTSKVILSTFEESLSQKHNMRSIPSYFLLDKFCEILGLQSKKEITFFVGSDNYHNFKDIFTDGEYILENYNVKEIKEDLDIRSTYIRTAVRESSSLKDYTSRQVINIINKHNLYK